MYENKTQLILHLSNTRDKKKEVMSAFSRMNFIIRDAVHVHVSTRNVKITFLVDGWVKIQPTWRFFSLGRSRPYDKYGWRPQKMMMKM